MSHKDKTMSNVQKNNICTYMGYCIENTNDYISLTLSGRLMSNHHDVINFVPIYFFLTTPLPPFLLVNTRADISLFLFSLWGCVNYALNCVSLRLFLLVRTFQMLHKREIYVLLSMPVAVPSEIENRAVVRLRHVFDSCVYKIMKTCQ